MTDIPIMDTNERLRAEIDLLQHHAEIINERNYADQRLWILRSVNSIREAITRPAPAKAVAWQWEVDGAITTNPYVVLSWRAQGGTITPLFALRAPAEAVPVAPDVVEAARFLLERLDDFDGGSWADEELYRQFAGHVYPAMGRLRSALSTRGREAGAAAVPGGWKLVPEEPTEAKVTRLRQRVEAYEVAMSWLDEKFINDAPDAEVERLTRERDHLKLQAQCHASEARTANSTIYEIYQVLSGGKGEPGNWHGAEPAKEYVAATEAKIADLLGEFQRLQLAYVNLLEIGRDRILYLGGQCDPVDVMEKNDPALIRARAAAIRARGE